jgi:hypothetical protein
MTAPAFILPAVANNVKTPTLLGSIGAGDTSVVVQSGEGALFPTIYRGDCSSTGSGTALNDTGALGSVAVGDFIYNLTDGSWAVVTSISGAPNSITTTPLEGGSDNTWQSGDIWIVNMFIITAVKYDTDGVTVLKRERMKVTNKVSDTLTVVRAYDGDSAQTFDADDSIQLLIEKSQMENMQKAVRNFMQKIYTNTTDIAANFTSFQKDAPMWLGTVSGTNTLTGSLTPAITAYAAGQRVAFIVANTNTGGVTLNVNSLGAKTIYRLNGTTALIAGDFVAGQLVMLQYDGTNFQMLTPSGNAASSKDYDKVVYLGKGVSSGVGGTADANFDTHTYSIPANDLVDGVAYRFTAHLFYGSATSRTFSVKLGSTAICTVNITTSNANQAGRFFGEIWGTAAAGASVAVNGVANINSGNGATSERILSTGITSAAMPTANVATNGSLTLQFSVSKGASTTDYLMGVVIEKLSTTSFA